MNGNPPLNDCLYSGPSLLPSFADVLMRFRFHKVALVADIEKAFLMVSISPSDRDALRFIWLDDIHKDNPKEVVYRFCRVVFGVTSSTFLLNPTIKQHLQKYANGNPELVQSLLNSLYVETWRLGSRPSKEGSMCSLIQGNSWRKADLIFGSGSQFHRNYGASCKIATNSPNTKHESSSNKGQVPRRRWHLCKNHHWNGKGSIFSVCKKVLGVNWNYLEDCSISPLKPLAQLVRELPRTKRSILKVLAKIFDPPGVISPVTF